MKPEELATFSYQAYLYGEHLKSIQNLNGSEAEWNAELP